MRMKKTYGMHQERGAHGIDGITRNIKKKQDKSGETVLQSSLKMMEVYLIKIKYL